MSVETSYCPKGLAKGVMLEVLWDVERCTEEGRRCGERITESVWWRAEVIELHHEGGSLIATVKYEPMHGFDSQTAQLYVFPSHVQPIGENEVTQLRWRFFESSGNVSYDLGVEDNEKWVGGSASPLIDDDRFTSMEKKMDYLSKRIQEVERISTAKSTVLSQFSGTPEMVDTRIEGLLAMLRQKLAFNTQKALPSSRNRGAEVDVPALVDRSSTGTIRVGIDFPAEDFERLCQLIQKKDYKVQFRVDRRPTFPSSGCLKACTAVSEVFFGSLTDLCETIGITERVDQMTIAMRKKYSVPNTSGNMDDAVIRICGTLFEERWEKDPLSMILICRALHELVPKDDEVCVLRRENTKLNPRTKWYMEPLTFEFISASDMVRELTNVTVVTNPRTLEDAEYIHSARMLASDAGRFALRWKPLPSLNPKIWTRRIGYPSLLYGTLEVELPYVNIRGEKAVSEVEKVLSAHRLCQAMD